MKKYRLDQEEKIILDAIESGDWKLIKPEKIALQRYARIARDTPRKDRRMNIRISKMDLHGIKVRAAEEGVPYQTLVAGVIHKYVTGRFVPTFPGRR